LTASSELIPHEVLAALGPLVEDVARLGVRTAQMHQALADSTGEPAFEPEPLTANGQRQFAERTLQLIEETFELARKQAAVVTGRVRERDQGVLAREEQVAARIQDFAGRPIAVHKIRCHGDYHLGQVLITKSEEKGTEVILAPACHDFVIIDFEGEPARPLAQRREKQLALRDVAGMIRSFHYASRTGATSEKNAATPADATRLDIWSEAWHFWMSAAFLEAYRRTAAGAIFLPKSSDDFERLLDACLLEKAVYELRYELNNRPDWVYLPLAALAELVR
jgi:maltose alpha-D-glucosyltransferase/alpha-amylase